jgi:hypothetical protein
LRIYTHEQLPSLLTQHDDKSCIPCKDASSVALLRRSQIERYVYGAWQDTHEVHDCIKSIFKILQIDPSISLLRQQELDQILCLGEAPTRWKRPGHFPPQDGASNSTFST